MRKWGVAIGIAFWGFEWRTLLSRYWKLGDHKHIEVEVFGNWGCLFSIEGGYTPKTALYSHQELDVELWLLGFGLRVSWYDSRHGDQRREEVDTDPGTGPVQG